jgi:hypothetical protein
MIQWNLRAKTLQAMIRAFEQQGGNLQQHFGDLTPAMRRLLTMPQSTKAELEAVIEQARRNRIAAPAQWEAALLSLCADPLYCRLQVDDLKIRVRAAWTATRALALGTARGLTMMFDIIVGDGLGQKKMNSIRARLQQRESAAGRALSEREKLVEIADEAAKFAGRWQDERRARRFVIANGTGIYRGSRWDLDRLFPQLNDPL